MSTRETTAATAAASTAAGPAWWAQCLTVGAVAAVVWLLSSTMRDGTSARDFEPGSPFPTLGHPYGVGNAGWTLIALMLVALMVAYGSAAIALLVRDHRRDPVEPGRQRHAPAMP